MIFRNSMESDSIKFQLSLKFNIIRIMIPRTAAFKLTEMTQTYKAVAVTGPRQSGKTTLVRSLFPDKPYVSLENPDNRKFATEDPRGFLKQYADGAIFDEVQRTPDLFSWLQEILDQSPVKGRFIFTSSNNLFLQENISQSLAGRIVYLNLLPFSLEELRVGEVLPDEFFEPDNLLLKGCYPPVHDQRLPSVEWAKNYIRTYIERDVRQIKNVTDLLVFERFMRLLAGRNAHELNYSSLSIEVGVDVKTIQSWIGILENSYIVFLQRPYFRNFNKTIVKRPRLFFYDTSIVCALLDISEPKHLQSHPLRGALFESFIVSEMAKRKAHRGIDPVLYYWRDKHGYEIDLIEETESGIIPTEIKMGSTVHSEYFKNLKYFQRVAGLKTGRVIYTGTTKQSRSDGIEVLPWLTA